MNDFLTGLDTSLFLLINGWHSPFWDQVMYYSTRAIVWLPFYIFFLILILKHYRKQTILILIAVILMITASDQLSNVFKFWVERPRPSHEPGLPVHLVNLYKGGMYGFYSAHASNFFALAMFLNIMLKKYYGWFVLPVMLWAGYLSYTRIYLGVHYPGDILAGTAIGLSFGYFFGSVTREVCSSTRDWFRTMN